VGGVTPVELGLAEQLVVGGVDEDLGHAPQGGSAWARKRSRPARTRRSRSSAAGEGAEESGCNMAAVLELG
jgi:hypothetical protein